MRTLTCLNALIIGLALLIPSGVAQAELLDKSRADTQPWSGYWWPLREGRMLKPLAKYDAIMGSHAADWERRHHGPSADTPTWHGYCHAWAASSVLEPQPRQTISVATVSEGAVALSVGDQKGLLAACHSQDIANTYGDRFGDGSGSEDLQDLAPDELWRLLNIYIRQQKIPLILDIEAGPEVWNYPVYMYQVDREAQQDGWNRARMTLWMADNGVPQDFVGVQVRRHVYHFQYRSRNGAVVAGSGRWIGTSMLNHPDFAWYPFVARAENPELDVAAVQQMLTQRRVVPRPSPTETSSELASDGPDASEVHSTGSASADEGPEPQVSDTANATRRPAEVEGRESVVSDSDPAEPADRLQLSPFELAALVTSRTSGFALDVTVDRFDGGRYELGQELSVRVSSAEPGWLFLFRVSPDGELSLVYPVGSEDNRVDSVNSKTVPAEGAAYKFVAPGPVGVHRIKAVVTSSPCSFTGLRSNFGDPQSSIRDPRPSLGDTSSVGDSSQFRWHPTQREQIEGLLRRYMKEPSKLPSELGDFQIDRLLGRFAQDEVLFHVSAASQKTKR